MSQQQTPHLDGLIPVWTTADRLRKAREHVGLSQIEFAAETGMSRQTIGNYENGNTRPNRVFVAAWALRTGVPVEWLLTGAVPTPNPDDHGSPVTKQYTPNVVELASRKNVQTPELARTA